MSSKYTGKYNSYNFYYKLYVENDTIYLFFLKADKVSDGTYFKVTNAN